MLRTVGNGELVAEKNTMQGYENYHGTKHYFYLEFDQEPIETGSKNTENRNACYAGFDENTHEVRIRYGISYISCEQARKNLENEIAGFDIDALANAARAKWNQTLGKIEVEGATEDQKTVFIHPYTELTKE